MQNDHLYETIICECGEKSIAQAMTIFQNTDLAYKKAKKLVTGCDKSCCREPLMKLFDQVYFGHVHVEEIVHLIEKRHNKFKAFLEDISKA